jgi:site-specific DNA recombinase
MAELTSGQASTAKDITLREGLRKGAVSRVLPLAFLAPDIADAILDGNQPFSLTARFLRELPDLPADWTEQRTLLGLSSL